MTLLARLQTDMKLALKNQEKAKLSAIRLILAAIKQVEIDKRKALTDDDVMQILSKLAKQRADAKQQYEKANRQDLADQESFELELINTYLPPPFSDQKIDALIGEAIKDAKATSIKDMGGVMAILKPQLQGRADMKKISNKIKAILAGS